MADVAAVSVANEDGQVRARRVGVGGEEPAVQFDAVTRLESDILERPAELGPGRTQGAVRVIDLIMFKPAQHDENEQTAEQQADP